MATGDAARSADLHAAIPKYPRMFQFPADGKRLIDLHCLACLYALSAEYALAGVVAIEGIGHVDFIRFGFEGMLLVLNIQLQCRVVDPAILIVVIACLLYTSRCV